MKFMKLGTRPDTFFTSDSARCASSEIATDIVVQVQDARFLLHKFPLLSKCARLKRLLLDLPTAGSPPPETVVDLERFPGGSAAFELCAKFCYGITITLGAANIVAARCAAEYLQMTDDLEKGNLAAKLDSFLYSCVLRRWRDSLVVLQTTRKLPLWSEELGITSRCIDAIASAIVVNLSTPNPGEWWAEDISELGIDNFWRIMVAVKSSGRVSASATSVAVMVYARRWLQNCGCNASIDVAKKQRSVLEKIVSLIPGERGAVPCAFLLQLLKAANALEATALTKAELVRRAGIQLEEAEPAELLIPASPEKSDTIYDVDVVILMLEEFLMKGRQSQPESPQRRKPDAFQRTRRSRSAEDVEFECGRRSSSVSHGSKLKVAKIIDEYLQEIARDVSFPMEKLLVLAEAVPEFARTNHDDLYRAIDIYLKAHPDLSKGERKRLCRALDCRKLSVEACMHAAQNEMLPLRVVVQVLFFEQVRTQMKDLAGDIKALLTTTTRSTVTPNDLENNDDWRSVSTAKLGDKPTLKMKLDDEDEDDEDDDVLKRSNEELVRSSSSRFKALAGIPGKPKKMISKLWSLSRNPSRRC